jgi:hypothetical protein
MARRLSEEQNELKIRDQLSNSEIVLYYKMPTTEQRLQYFNESVQRKGNRIVTRIGEQRQHFGFLILTGFRDGDFEIYLENQYVPISSNPASRHFHPDWKQWLKEHAMDLIELLAVHVFEASAVIEDTSEIKKKSPTT